jgi:hypothetical protein
MVLPDYFLRFFKRDMACDAVRTIYDMLYKPTQVRAGLKLKKKSALRRQSIIHCSIIAVEPLRQSVRARR